LTITAGERIDDSLLATGDTVTMNGEVTGNLIAFGRRVRVRGHVGGSVFTFARRLDLSGTVHGNVVSLTETVGLNGHVGRSAHSFARAVTLASDAHVSDDLMTFAAEADLHGGVGRDVLAFASVTRVAGQVESDLSAWTGRLWLDAPARIGGDLVAHVSRPEEVSMDPAARVNGSRRIDLPAAHASRYLTPAFYLWRLLWLGAAFVTGLVVHQLAPWLLINSAHDLAGLLKPLGLGLLVLVATPVAAILAAVSLIGMPLALIVLGLWSAALYLSGILAAAAIGRVVLSGGQRTAPALARSLLTGLLLLTVAANLPYVGDVLRMLAVLFGLGLGALQVWRRHGPQGPLAATGP
jgi:hypothetical protein